MSQPSFLPPGPPITFEEERLRYEAALALARAAYAPLNKVFSGSEKVMNVVLAAQALLQARILLGPVADDMEKHMQATGEFNELFKVVREWQEKIDKLKLREAHEMPQVIEVNFR